MTRHVDHAQDGDSAPPGFSTGQGQAPAEPGTTAAAQPDASAAVAPASSAPLEPDPSAAAAPASSAPAAPDPSAAVAPASSAPAEPDPSAAVTPAEPDPSAAAVAPASSATDAGGGRSGRLVSAIATVRGRAERLAATRDQNPFVEIGLSTLERDQARGGGLLAGALAYRLFFWLLPFTLVLVAGLGFLAASDTSGTKDVLRYVGVVGFAAKSIATASEQAEQSRWWVLGIGLFGLYLASVSFLKALTVSASLLWGVPARKLRRKPLAAVAMSGFVVLALGLLGLETKVRAATPGFGFPFTFMFMVAVAMIWLVVSRYLPRAEGTGWWSLVPGAALFAIGVQAVHLTTVYYVSRKFESASSTYGFLGAATAMLLTLFLMGRVMVIAIEFNAILWEHRDDRLVRGQVDNLRTMALERGKGVIALFRRLLDSAGRLRRGR